MIPVAGMRVVVTGAIAGESRQTAERKLREAGALVQPGVNGMTDLLVTGAKVGPSKIAKAKALGVGIVTWEQVFAPAPAGTAAAVSTVPAVPVAAPPRQIGPMLAKAGDLPVGEAWLFEVKWDGYRCVATVRDGQMAMQSRSGKSEYAEQFPGVAEQLAHLPDCVIDGELVVLDENGTSSFERMTGGQPTFVAFDLLEHPTLGDLRGKPLTERRDALERLLDRIGPERSRTKGHRWIQVSPAFDDGAQLMEYVRQHGLEGIVAKRRTSRYHEGSRAGDWIKAKVRLSQEFAVVGWKPGEGGRGSAAGSLLLAVHNGDRFEFVGRVGTGQKWEFWQSVTNLTPVDPDGPITLKLDTNGAPAAELRDVVWVEPALVVQVEFQRWTSDGRLWHPSVLGVRDDKTPTECRREG